MEGIYIGGRSIRTFGAKLRTDYTSPAPAPAAPFAGSHARAAFLCWTPAGGF